MFLLTRTVHFFSIVLFILRCLINFSSGEVVSDEPGGATFFDRLFPMIVAVGMPNDFRVNLIEEETMGKKIAVLVRDRQGEALRMSVGITLMDDTIDVYVLDKKVESNDDNDLNIETIKDMGMKLATNTKENDGMDFISTEELAQKLLEYDHIVPF